MTPTTRTFEDRLHDALLDRFDDLSHLSHPSPVTSVHRSRARRLAVPVGGLAAAAAISAVAVDLAGGAPTGGGTAPARAPGLALAAWTSRPTAAAPAQTSGAEARCSGALDPASGGQGASGKQAPPPPPGGPWSPVLVDTRGDLSLALYSNGTAWIACLDTPSFVQVNAFGTNALVAVSGSSATLDKLSVKGTAGAVYTVAIGRAGSPVTGVALQLPDGSEVTATLGGGHYVAWWPGTAGVTALAVSTDAGTRTTPVDQRFAQPAQPANHTVHQPESTPGTTR